MAFAVVDDKDLKNWKPTIVHVDEDNNPIDA